MKHQILRICERLAVSLDQLKAKVLRHAKDMKEHEDLKAGSK